MFDIRAEWVKLLKACFTNVTPVYPKDFKALPIVSYNVLNNYKIADNRNDWDRDSENRLEYEYFEFQLDFWAGTIYDIEPMIKKFDERLEDEQLRFTRYYTSPDMYDGKLFHRVTRYRGVVDVRHGIVYTGIRTR